MSEQLMNPMSVGLDDGYAVTKLALPDGRLVAVSSRARLGRANVTWLDNAEQRIFEYETDDQSFAVGEVDGEPTYFDAYPFSGLNRAIVQHGLQQAGLGGQSLHAVSGLPVKPCSGTSFSRLVTDLLREGQETVAADRPRSWKKMRAPCLPGGRGQDIVIVILEPRFSSVPSRILRRLSVRSMGLESLVGGSTRRDDRVRRG